MCTLSRVALYYHRDTVQMGQYQSPSAAIWQFFYHCEWVQGHFLDAFARFWATYGPHHSGGTEYLCAQNLFCCTVYSNVCKATVIFAPSHALVCWTTLPPGKSFSEIERMLLWFCTFFWTFCGDFGRFFGRFLGRLFGRFAAIFGVFLDGFLGRLFARFAALLFFRGSFVLRRSQWMKFDVRRLFFKRRTSNFAFCILRRCAGFLAVFCDVFVCVDCP